MRVAGYIVAFSLVTSQLCAGNGPVVSVPLTPNWRIEEHVAAISGPERTLTIAVQGGAPHKTKRQVVAVRGSITVESVEGIVRSALAAELSYWSDQMTSSVAVVGDSRYANVVLSMHCGDLCGGGATFTYAFVDGQWQYQYTYNQWVS